MTEISNKTISRIRSAVDRYEKSSRLTRSVYLCLLSALAIILLAVIIHAHFIANNLEQAMAPGGVLASLFSFVFVQLRGMDRCLWEANTLEVVAEAGGKEQLLSTLENISCKKLTINLGR